MSLAMAELEIVKNCTTLEYGNGLVSRGCGPCSFRITFIG